MMAVYTIYVPPRRACPIAITGGDFWKHPETFSLTVNNTGSKTITGLTLTPEMFLAPQDLRRPFNMQWSSAKAISPGQEQTIEHPGVPAASAQTVMGWALLPSSVKYEDGTNWRPESEGECFGAIWRDPQHPDIPVLPPRQIEMNPD
jgi:hypothetical protein